MPILHIHGDKDELVPLQQSELICEKFKEAGVPCELVVKKGAGHGWSDFKPDMAAIGDWFDTHLSKEAVSSRPDITIEKTQH